MSSCGGAVLEVAGITKAYGEHVALAEVDLQVRPGEVCALLGPNGAGKTTLVAIIAGLRRADTGSVHVDGVDVDAARNTRRARRLVGLAGQETGIYPTVTVRENLELFARLAGLKGADRTRRMDDVAATLELTGLMVRLASALSGGEKRRLHTAMALLHRPRVLLLDEPTTGVDIATRSRLLRAITDLAARDESAVVYSTHYLPEVEEMGASVAILDRGRILTRGTLADLVDRHGTAMIELAFDGLAPPVAGGQANGPTVQIRSNDPGGDLPGVLAQLGPDVARLKAVNLVRPSLESVFLAISGRAYRNEEAGAHG